MSNFKSQKQQQQLLWIDLYSEYILMYHVYILKQEHLTVPDPQPWNDSRPMW